jgi:hypothetical protein
MSGDGLTTDTNVLATLARDLHDCAGRLDATMKTYQVTAAPRFGQDSPVVFPPAHDLSGAYQVRAADHAATRAELVTWVSTMARVAEILSTRYSTVEELGAADAQSIRSALDQGTAAVSVPVGS